MIANQRGGEREISDTAEPAATDGAERRTAVRERPGRIWTSSIRLRCPSQPAKPNRWLIVGAGAAIAFILGLALAGVQEAKDTSLKNLKDVRAYTNLPVLSSIPLLENTMLVRRKRRIAYLAWSAAVIVGMLAVSASLYYHYTYRSRTYRKLGTVAADTEIERDARMSRVHDALRRAEQLLEAGGDDVATAPEADPRSLVVTDEARGRRSSSLPIEVPNGPASRRHGPKRPGPVGTEAARGRLAQLSLALQSDSFPAGAGDASDRCRAAA